MSINSKFIKKITAIVTIILFIFSFLPTQMVFALNGQSNNPLDNMGYRIISPTEICVWTDKPVNSATASQFKLFKGSSSLTGTPVAISSAAFGIDTLKTSSLNTTYLGSSGGGGVTIKVASTDAFVAGETYTLVLNGSLSAQNGHSLWQFSRNLGCEFNFTMPDTTPAAISDLNCTGNYKSSEEVQPLLSSWITSPGGNVNVPLERNIWFSFNMPVTKLGNVILSTALSSGGTNPNNTAAGGTNLNIIAQAVKVYKNVSGSWVEVTYNPLTSGGTNSQTAAKAVNKPDTNELGSPVISNDNTCIGIPMSAGGSAISYNFAYNTEYKVSLPQLTFINDKTMNAQDYTFTTAPALTPADMIGVTPTAAADSSTPGNIKISWATQSASSKLAYTQIGSKAYTYIPAFAAPSGYNIYYSKDMYWDFKLLNTEGPVSPSATTSAYSFDPYAKGLDTNTNYYFRVSSVNNTNPDDTTLSSGLSESGMSQSCLVVPVSEVTLDKTSDTISVGNTDQLTATIYPANATNKSVTWASDNNAVATVSDTGLVTAVSAGTANITVITADGNKKAICAVTVLVAAPSVTANDAANKIVGINSTMEYCIDGGSWIKYASDPDLSGNHTVTVRIPADDTTGLPAGAVTTLAFTTNPAAPAAPSVTANDAANKIVGINSTMEYCIYGGSWTKYAADPDLSGNHTVMIRIPADDTTGTPAGAVTTLTFTNNPAAPAAPSVTANDTANKIVGINSTMEYCIDGGSWIKYASDPDLSGNHTVMVRIPADDTTGTPAGAVTTLSFTSNPAAPAAPSVTANDAANKIVGINSTMEYCIYGGCWTKYAADPDLSENHTVMVRIPADDTTGTPAGAVTTLSFTTNPAAPAAPSVTANDAANTVTGMAAGMEYSLNGAAYVPYNEAAFNGIDLSGNHTINIRVAFNSITGAPASAITALKFTNTPTASVVNVTPAVSADSTSAIVNVTVNESQIEMDGTNVITVPNSASSVSTSIGITSIKNGVGTEEIHATVGKNALTLTIPFDAVNLSSVNDSTAKFVLSQTVSTDATAADMLANAPTGDKTIGKVFSFNLDVAGIPVHNFADGKTATISIKLTADDIKGLDTSKLSAFYYDETSGKWIQVGGSYDPNTMIFTFSTTHFTSFTIMQTSTSTVSSTLPKTGSPVDLFTLMFIGVSFLGAGLFITVKKWRRNIK